MSSLYKKLTVCCLMLCMLTGCAGSRQAMSGQADVVDETTERTGHRTGGHRQRERAGYRLLGRQSDLREPVERA